MSATPRPNIVFFMMDQLSAKWLEAPASAACPTPNIDRLRARGVSFSQTFTSNPVCTPARSTLATGLTTRQHGVLQNGYQLDPAIPTFMRILQSAGWRTGAFGKFHVEPHFKGVHPDYRLYGFDVTRITEDPRAGDWLDWLEREHPEHYEAALATIWCRAIPEFRHYGPDGIDLSARIAAARGKHVWPSEAFPHDGPGCHTLPFPETVSQTAWITDCATDFIRATDPAVPLLAHISYVQPHGPSCPPGEFMQRVDVDRIPEPLAPTWMEDPAMPTCFRTHESVRSTIPDDWRLRRQYYFADVAHLDTKLGLVMDALQAAGRLASTYIILVTDHGELLMDHGFRGKGEVHYDACVRVPLIIAGPGLGQGTTTDAIVQLEDIFPTVLEMAGVPEPAPNIMGPYLKQPPARTVPGRSLVPLCRGEMPTDWRDAAYIESYNNITKCTIADWARTVRTHRWRYTLYPGGNGEQLFDLAADPDEQTNLARDPGHASVRQELRDHLLDLVIRQDFPHTPNNQFALGVH